MTTDPAALAVESLVRREIESLVSDACRDALASCDPATLAARCAEFSDIITVVEEKKAEIRDRLKGMLLGEATEAPPGGWVYGPITVQYVKPSERTSINRKKLVQQGVTLEQIEASMDVTKLAPTIRVVKSVETVTE